MKNFTLADAAALQALATKLGKLEAVSRFDNPDEPQGWTLAYALKDINEECLRLTSDLIPRLIISENDHVSADLLLDIGFSLKHIIYHAFQPEFYAYLRDYFEPNENGEG